MIVVDASLVLDIITASSDGERICEALSQGSAPLVAPEIIELEVLQTLRRFIHQGLYNETTAQKALQILDEMHIERYSHTPLRTRIWELRDNLTAYDAAYFALSELLDAPLWTRDKKFLSVPGHQAQINVL